MRVLPLFLSASAALVMIGLAWWLPNRPQPLVHPFTGVLQGVSFAPYKGQQSPLTLSFPSLDQINDGLRILAGKVKSVRLYSSQEGMEAVPPMAAKLGLKVFAGAWIGANDSDNQKEIATLIKMANDNPDTINRVIVGNEVLLRKDQTAASLIKYIREVKAAVKQPVTYADVWEFWLKHPELGPEVDFITVHILPYWEDIPLPVRDGNAHVDDILERLHKVFPGKPIVIGEIGWPTHGRSREAAVPGRFEAATFLTNFLDKAATEGLHYNIIEAFDQPWKSKLEGIVGANWGLYDRGWQPKLNLAGPVIEEPWWPEGILGASLIALILIGWQRRLIARLGPAPAVAAGLIVALSAYCASCAGAEAWFFGYMIWPQLFAYIKAALALALAVAVVVTAVRQLAGGEAPHPGSFQTLWPSLVLGTILTLAFLQSVLIVIDGRYRDFQSPYMTLAAFGPLMIGWVASVTGRRRFAERLAFMRLFDLRPTGAPQLAARVQLAAGLLFVLVAFATVVVETPDNLEACLWAGQLILMSLPLLAGFFHRDH